MGKIKKQDVIRGIAAKVDGATAKEAEAFFDATFAYITEQLAAGKAVPVPGFGTFALRHRKERMGRNVRTKELVAIEAVTAPVFKPGSSLKSAVADAPVDG